MVLNETTSQSTVSGYQSNCCSLLTEYVSLLMSINNKGIAELKKAIDYVDSKSKKQKIINSMKALEQLIAEKLLQIKAIKLQPNNPFTWASGWKSPIYCDNRKTLSYPSVRNIIKVEIARLICEKYPTSTAIAGVATGAIAMGALVADVLDLPFVYIRSEPKDHGLENLIEGELKPDAKVVIVEDLISTGGSSLKAVKAVRDFGCEVVGMIAIYTHGFPVAEKNFKNAKIPLITLSDYNTIIEEALRTDYISEDDIAILQKWRKKPETWGVDK
jgi:orotate phosphoribosyltransferase